MIEHANSGVASRRLYWIPSARLAIAERLEKTARRVRFTAEVRGLSRSPSAEYAELALRCVAKADPDCPFEAARLDKMLSKLHKIYEELKK